jgi:hypothetical protein
MAEAVNEAPTSIYTMWDILFFPIKPSSSGQTPFSLFLIPFIFHHFSLSTIMGVGKIQKLSPASIQ